MITGPFLEPNPEFTAWAATLDPKHWSKYDLSACRLGWEAGVASVSGPAGQEKLAQTVASAADSLARISTTLTTVNDRRDAVRIFEAARDLEEVITTLRGIARRRPPRWRRFLGWLDRTLP